MARNKVDHRGGVYIHDVGQIIINTIFPLKIFGVQIESVMTSSVVHCETNQILGKRGSGDACFPHPLSPVVPQNTVPQLLQAQ